MNNVSTLKVWTVFAFLYVVHLSGTMRFVGEKVALQVWDVKHALRVLLLMAHLHLIGTQPSTRLLKLTHNPDGSSLPATQEIKILICLRCLRITCLSLWMIAMAMHKEAMSTLVS